MATSMPGPDMEDMYGDDVLNKILHQIEELKVDSGSENVYSELIQRIALMASYGSRDFQKQNFHLSALEVQTLLERLEKKNGIKATSTSCWNLPSSRRTAVYKLFKVIRWLMKDEDMIFDPLHRSAMVNVDTDLLIDDVCGFAKHPHSSQESHVQQIRSLSVNRILYKYLTEESAQALVDIDDSLSVLDMSTEEIADGPDGEKITELCDSVQSTISQINSKTARIKAIACNWIQKLIKYIILQLAEKNQVLEEQYALMFEEFVALVLQAVTDWDDFYQVRGATIHFGRQLEMRMKELCITSEADLYICHEEVVKTTGHVKDLLIAVVEVKARDAKGNIIASSCTTTPGPTDEKEDIKKKLAPDAASFSTRTNTTATDSKDHNVKKSKTNKNVKERGAAKTVTFAQYSSEKDSTGSDDDHDDEKHDADKEDSDVPDYDDIEETRIESPPNDNLRRMNQEEKLVLRHFLPQLLGEMMCTFELSAWKGIKEYHGSYRLGMAVTGLLVQFVAIIIHHDDDNFPQRTTTSLKRSPEGLQLHDDLRTVVFLTRPLDMLRKKDRRIIMRTIASAALLTKFTAATYLQMR